MEHEDYPMPQLTEQEKEAAFRRLLVKGANIKRRLAHFPNSEMLKLDLIGVQIALAALNAAPMRLKPVTVAKNLTIKDSAHQSHLDYAEGYNDRAEMDRNAIRAAGYEVKS